jgi:hypothetical protein
MEHDSEDKLNAVSSNIKDTPKRLSAPSDPFATTEITCSDRAADYAYTLYATPYLHEWRLAGASYDVGFDVGKVEGLNKASEMGHYIDRLESDLKGQDIRIEELEAAVREAQDIIEQAWAESPDVPPVHVDYARASQDRFGTVDPGTGRCGMCGYTGGRHTQECQYRDPNIVNPAVEAPSVRKVEDISSWDTLAQGPRTPDSPRLYSKDDVTLSHEQAQRVVRDQWAALERFDADAKTIAVMTDQITGLSQSNEALQETIAGLRGDIAALNEQQHTGGAFPLTREQQVRAAEIREDAYRRGWMDAQEQVNVPKMPLLPRGRVPCHQRHPGLHPRCRSGDGMTFTTDPNDPRLTHGVDDEPTPMAEVYLVLSEEERARGFVRPVRSTYVHMGPIQGTSTPCGAATTMGMALAETYARDPKFYGATYCTTCQRHAPVSEFTWDGTDEKVGS